MREEGGVGPQFTVEIASKSNTEAEMREKLAFYDRYGVQEYLVYDYPRGVSPFGFASNPTVP